jgi:hypothetical protein
MQSDGEETRTAQGAFLKELGMPIEFDPLNCGLDGLSKMSVSPTKEWWALTAVQIGLEIAEELKTKS